MRVNPSNPPQTGQARRRLDGQFRNPNGDECIGLFVFDIVTYIVVVRTGYM
jgi:hypothetical protein